MKMNIVIIIWPWYKVGVAVLDLSVGPSQLCCLTRRCVEYDRPADDNTSRNVTGHTSGPVTPTPVDSAQ